MEGRISILIGTKETLIQVKDSLSGITFLKVKLTPEQLSAALSMMALTECEFEVKELDKIGKKMQTAIHEFKLPWDRHFTKEEVIAEAERTCPEGWTQDGYFGSQGSFFMKGDEQYARVTIRKWE